MSDHALSPRLKGRPRSLDSMVDMGTWDATIFGDDTACDVRGCYRALIEDGMSDAEATRQTLKAFRSYLKGPAGTSAIVALALTQSEIGRLDPNIRDRALAAIDNGGDVDIWREESPRDVGKRRAALTKARARLTGPQPARRLLKPPRRVVSDLVAGDVLALDRSRGPALVRVVRVKSDREGESSCVLEELVFRGKKLPSLEAIRKLRAREVPERDRDLYPNCHFVAMFGKKAGWKETGFQKVAQTAARAGDSVLEGAGVFVFWTDLARMLRRGERVVDF